MKALITCTAKDTLSQVRLAHGHTHRHAKTERLL